MIRVAKTKCNFEREALIAPFGFKGLHLTFVLNALVAVDNAVWLLYCRKNGISDFSSMIPKFMEIRVI